MGSGLEYIIPAVISVAASAAGTGMSMYAQSEQAKTSQRMAEYNAAIQRQDADMQARLAQYQAGVNAQVAQAQAQAQINNAQTLANQAVGVEAEARERARRSREESERAQSLMRARYAKSGVVAEGTPLVVLANEGRNAELAVHTGLYQSELQRQSLLRQSELERYQSNFSLMEAAQYDYEGLAASAGKRIAYRNANMTVLAGQAQASALRSQGTASLFSGISSAAGTAMNYAYMSPSVDRSTMTGGTYNPYAKVLRAQAV